MKEPPITSGDVHFVVNAKTKKIKCFDSEGSMVWTLEAHCVGTAGSSEHLNGDTPPGLYRCGAPDNVIPAEGYEEMAKYGPWFIPLEEQEGQLSKRRRVGIGVHGGGSTDSKNPYFAARQGWVATHGCIRMQNQDLIKFAHTVFHTQGKRKTAWLSVQE